MSDEKQPIIDCEDLVKIYKTEDIEVVALQGLDLNVQAGELMSIIGNSGSGKSTLLNMIGALDRPTAGKLFVDGADLFRLSPRQMVRYKRDTVGFVWQNNARNLIPYLTARDNVELVLGMRGGRKRGRSRELLELTGVAHRSRSRLSELSGGEQQRVAIAIALCNGPRILLADEPTGSVDSKTAGAILDLFRELNRTLGLTVVIVTHDQAIAKKVDRVVAIRDGRTSSEFLRKSYAEELQQLETGAESDAAQDADSHEEFAVLDRYGRLQLPKEYMEQIGVVGRDKVRVSLADGWIRIDPQEKPEK